MKFRSRWLFVVGVLTLALSAGAEETTSRGGSRRLDQGLGLAANPLGLQHTLDLRWTWPLTSSRSPLLSAARFSVGASHFITPSYTRLGAWVELAPLSIIEIRAGAEPGAYFGSFGSLTSFDSYSDPFDDDARTEKKGEARSGTGSRFYLSPKLKATLGPLILTGGADVEWWRSSASGPFYYEPARDTLLKTGGDRLLRTSTAILRRHGMGGGGDLFYGVTHSLSYVLDAPANRSQRLGIVAVRQFGHRRFGLRSPRIAGQLSYYLSDPSRKGQLAASLGLSIGLAR